MLTLRALVLLALVAVPCETARIKRSNRPGKGKPWHKPKPQTFAVVDFSPYPGDAGGDLSGKIMIKQGEVDGVPSQILTWYLKGTDDNCPMGTGNVCGIHIHVGKTCEDHEKIGGHLWNEEVEKDDPWTKVRYASSSGKSFEKKGVEVVTGLLPENIIGRSVVVHNSAGAGDRFACGIIKPMGKHMPKPKPKPKSPEYAVVDFNPYPGDAGGDLSGKIMIKQGEVDGVPSQILTWFLKGTDDRCPMGTGNVCGIHIHVGRTCKDHAEIGGHLWNEEASKSDPWTMVRYSSSSGKSFEKKGVEVVTGLLPEDIIGRSVVVHNSEGAGDRFACGIIKALPGAFVETEATKSEDADELECYLNSRLGNWANPTLRVKCKVDEYFKTEREDKRGGTNFNPLFRTRSCVSGCASFAHSPSHGVAFCESSEYCAHNGVGSFLEKEDDEHVDEELKEDKESLDEEDGSFIEEQEDDKVVETDVEVFEKDCMPAGTYCRRGDCWGKTGCCGWVDCHREEASHCLCH